jgi:hypothetical protein
LALCGDYWSASCPGAKSRSILYFLYFNFKYSSGESVLKHPLKHCVYPQLPDFLYTNSSSPISIRGSRVATTEQPVKVLMRYSMKMKFVTAHITYDNKAPERIDDHTSKEY